VLELAQRLRLDLADVLDAVAEMRTHASLAIPQQAPKDERG